MRYARFFSIFVFVALTLYGIAGFYCLPLAKFTGNLTRMGMVPDALFGWTKAQVEVDPALMQQASWQEADVLAIGDSFTMPLLWQTALTRRGLHVRTETWESMRNICEDFAGWAREKGFKGKYVVIEIIEYSVESRLERSVGCQRMSYHEIATMHPSMSLSGKLSIGIRAQFNAWKYQWLRRQPGFSGFELSNSARVAPVANGCDLFSHRECGDVLFYAGDHIPDFDEKTLAQMDEITRRLQGVTPIWAIVPDKSTAYLHPEKKFWDEVERRSQGPNLLKTFRRAIHDKTVDLYLGNDTHVSTTGYLILGEAIYQSMHVHP